MMRPGQDTAFRVLCIALVLGAAGCAPRPYRAAPSAVPPVRTATLPLGFEGDTLPCQTARIDLRRPVPPVPVVPGSAIPHRQLPGTVEGLGGERVSLHQGAVSPRGESFALMMLAEAPLLSLRLASDGAELWSVDSVWASAGANGGFVYSPDGRWIASAQQEGTVKLVSVRDGRVHAVLPHHRYRPKVLPPVIGVLSAEQMFGGAHSVSFSPDGRQLVSAGADGNVILWELRGRRPLWVRDTRVNGYPALRMQAAFLPDGQVLVMAGGGVEVLSRERGETVGILDVPTGEVPMVRDGVPVNLHSAVIGIAVSGNGALVAAHGRSVESPVEQGKRETATDWIHTWWWSACPDPGRFIRVPMALNGITLSPDARWIAAISPAGIHVWDAVTAQERFRIPATLTRTLAGAFNDAVGFSPDGRFLYSFHNHPRPVLVWELDAPRPAERAGPSDPPSP